MSPAIARTQTARSRVEHTNHQATAGMIEYCTVFLISVRDHFIRNLQWLFCNERERVVDFQISFLDTLKLFVLVMILRL